MTSAAKTESVANDSARTTERTDERVTKGFEDAASFGQETVEALVASSRIAMKAAESMNAEILAYSKRSYEDGLAAAKELTSCRSVTELAEKQAAIAREAADAFVKQATKLSELATSATREAIEPIGARLNVMARKRTSSRA